MQGNTFRKWRREREISQVIVAAFCNVNTATICRWELGKIKVSQEILNDIETFVNTNNE